MNTTFAMWRKTLSQLIRMEDKKEWDALDLLSRWFIATRSAVGIIGAIERESRMWSSTMTDGDSAPVREILVRQKSMASMYD